MGFISKYKQSILFEKNAFLLMISSTQFMLSFSVTAIIECFMHISLFHIFFVGIMSNIIKANNYNIGIILWNSFKVIIKSVLLILLLTGLLFLVSYIIKNIKSPIIEETIIVILLVMFLLSNLFLDQIIYNVDKGNPIILLTGSFRVMKDLYNQNQLHKLFLSNHISVIFIILSLISTGISLNISNRFALLLISILSILFKSLAINQNIMIRTLLYNKVFALKI